MTHKNKDKERRLFRVRLHPEAVKQVKAFALILGRDDWNAVLNDCILAGVAYLNSAAKAELADFDSSLRVVDLKSDLGLQVFRGTLPQLED